MAMLSLSFEAFAFHLDVRAGCTRSVGSFSPISGACSRDGKVSLDCLFKPRPFVRELRDERRSDPSDCQRERLDAGTPGAEAVPQPGRPHPRETDGCLRRLTTGDQWSFNPVPPRPPVQITMLGRSPFGPLTRLQGKLFGSHRTSRDLLNSSRTNPDRALAFQACWTPAHGGRPTTSRSGPGAMTSTSPGLGPRTTRTCRPNVTVGETSLRRAHSLSRWTGALAV